MKIQGLQKMTLLDFPGHVACTVFLGGCDFRCQFCHNYQLVEGSFPEAITEEEFFSFLEKRHGLLDGVAITGGEPCLRKDLPEFIRKIKESGFPVKLDTNGNHPGILKELLDNELLSYVAMDIKNSPKKYGKTIGLQSEEEFELQPIKESIRLLIESDIDYEFRTTVIDEYHDEEDFEEIGKLIEGGKKYYLQCFTDRDAVPDHSLTPPSTEKINRYRDIVSKYVIHAEVRGVEDTNTK